MSKSYPLINDLRRVLLRFTKKIHYTNYNGNDRKIIFRRIVEQKIQFITDSESRIKKWIRNKYKARMKARLKSQIKEKLKPQVQIEFQKPIKITRSRRRRRGGSRIIPWLNWLNI